MSQESFRIYPSQNINQMETSLNKNSSVRDEDLKLKSLFDWVKANGGVCSVEARRDT